MNYIFETHFQVSHSTLYEQEVFKIPLIVLIILLLLSFNCVKTEIALEIR